MDTHPDDADDPAAWRPSSLTVMSALLHRSQARFQALVDGSLQGILVHRGGRPLFANDAFARIYGYDRQDDILGLDTVLGHLPSGAAEAGGAEPMEFEGRRRDGAPVWVMSVGREIDWDGAPAIQVVQFDITERKRFERGLEARERELRGYFDAPLLGVSILTPDGVIIEANEMLARMMGCASDRLVGLSFRDFTAPEDVEDSALAYRRILAGEVERLTFEKRYIRPFDGGRFEGEVTLGCVRDHQGRPARVVSMVRDITDAKRAERDLREAKEVADRANAAKGRFLAAASHDLRQPVMALGLFVATLEAGTTDPALTPLVRKIKTATDELGALLNALLDISRLDAELVSAAPVVFPLGQLFETLERDFAPLARQAGLRLRVVATSAHVVSDPVLMGTILRNLVGNALRYTERGGVVLGCRRTGAGVRVEVWDSGCGIAPEDRTVIFQEFQQLRNRGRNRALGLGLGLAIVQRLAGLLGHRVGVRSEPGRGSMFSLEAPRGAAPAVIARSVPMIEPAPAGALVAVVDDDEIVRDGLVEVLTRWGHRVVSGASDMELLEALADLGDIPELLIADFRLESGRDGIELIAFLRRELDCPFPALLLTGDTAPDRLREAKASGLPLLHKPIGAADLKRAVDALLAGRV